VKKLFGLMVALGFVFAVVGCSGDDKKTETKKTETKTEKKDDKTETKKETKETKETKKEDDKKDDKGAKSISVTGPKDAIEAKQGETTKVTLDLTRTGFDEDVDVTFSDLPAGVTVKEKETKIAKGSKNVTVTLDVAKDAKEGSHTVKYTAKGGGAKDATGEFKVTVAKAK